MGTIVVGAILILIIALILRSMYKDKKAGKSLQCGVDCSKCGGHCSSQVMERRKQLEESKAKGDGIPSNK